MRKVNIWICCVSHIPPAPSWATSWLFGCQVFASVGHPEPVEGTGSDSGSLRGWKKKKKNSLLLWTLPEHETLQSLTSQTYMCLQKVGILRALFLWQRNIRSKQYSDTFWTFYGIFLRHCILIRGHVYFSLSWNTWNNNKKKA